MMFFYFQIFNQILYTVSAVCNSNGMVIPCMKYFLEKKMQLQKKNLFFPQEVTNNLLFIKCKTFLDLRDFLVSNLFLIPFSNRRRVNVFLRLSVRLSTISEISEPVF